MKKSIVGVLVALVLALGAPASGAVVGGGGVEGVVTDLGGVFLYEYTVYTGGATAVGEDAVEPTVELSFPLGSTVNSFLIPFFDPEEDAIIPGSIVPAPGWLAAFRNTADSSWDYDPLADPDSGSYEVPANVFVAPPFVLEFYVEPVTVAPAGEWVIIDPSLGITGFSFLSPYGDTNGPVVLGYAEGGLTAVDPPHVKSPSHPAAVVPEPTGLGLIGLAMLAARRRRG